VLLHGPDDEESAVALAFANKKPAERLRILRALGKAVVARTLQFEIKNCEGVERERLDKYKP
jgi:hypothetical protein